MSPLKEKFALTRRSAGRELVALLGAAVLLSEPVAAQEALAYADTIVTDSKGRPVPGLGPADFSITVGGVRGKVVSAAYVSGGGTGSEFTRPITVILFDSCDSPISLLGELAARDALEGLTAGPTAGKDELWVLPSVEGSGAIQRLSEDRALPGISGFTAGLPSRVGWACNYIPYSYFTFGHATSRRRDIREAGQATVNPRGVPVNGRRDVGNPRFFNGTASYNTMSAALEGLASLPGRKNLVVVSDFRGWQWTAPPEPQVRRLIDLANRAGVAIHVLCLLDAAGPGGPGAGLLYDAVERLSESTGGLWFFTDYSDVWRRFSVDTRVPDGPERALGVGLRPLGVEFRAALKSGMKQIAADSAEYYRIGYVSDAPRQADAKLDIKVTSRKSLKVRSWANPVPLLPAAPPTPAERLRAALRSPFRGFEIGVHVIPFFSAGEAEKKSARRSWNLRAALSVDARDLVLQSEPGGMTRADVDVIAAAYGRDNREVTVKTDNCSMRIAPDAKPFLADRVMLCELDLGRLEPGPYIVRVAVADKAGAKTGSAYAFAPVRFFSASALEASTLVLDAPGPRNEGPRAPRANRVDRVFAPGATVAYSFEAYNVKLDRKTEEPSLEVRLTIAGGQYDGASMIDSGFVPARTDAGWPIVARGEFTIPADAQPGPYRVRCIARDAVRGGEEGERDAYADFTVSSRASEP